MARKKKKKFKLEKKIVLIIILVFITLISVLIFSKKTVVSFDNYRIELDKTMTKIYIGEEKKVNYTIYHGDNTNQIVWSTTNSNIATVDGRGVIKGISFGKVTIQAKLLNGNIDSFDLIVMSHPVYFKINTSIKPIKNWFNKTIDITFDYENIDNIKYCLVTKDRCEPNINYKGKINLRNGIWHLYVKGLDKNNKEFLHNETFQIDLEKPKCVINRLGKWGNDNAIVEANCESDLSGIDRYEWYRDNEKVLVTTTEKINLNEIYLNGKHKYNVKIYDSVGNVSDIKID